MPTEEPKFTPYDITISQTGDVIRITMKPGASNLLRAKPVTSSDKGILGPLREDPTTQCRRALILETPDATSRAALADALDRLVRLLDALEPDDADRDAEASEAQP